MNLIQIKEIVSEAEILRDQIGFILESEPENVSKMDFKILDVLFELISVYLKTSVDDENVVSLKEIVDEYKDIAENIISEM